MFKFNIFKKTKKNKVFFNEKVDKLKFIFDYNDIICLCYDKYKTENEKFIVEEFFDFFMNFTSVSEFWEYLGDKYYNNKNLTSHSMSVILTKKNIFKELCYDPKA